MTQRAGSSLALAALLLGLLAGLPSSARAEWRPSGNISPFLIAEPENVGARVGGGTSLTLWQSFDWLEVGGMVGLAGLRHAHDEEDQVFGLLSLHLGLASIPDPIGLRLYGRAGVWAGARNSGLAAHIALGMGGAVEFALDEKIAFSLSLEGWFLGGEETRRFIAIGIGMTWRPEPDEF